MKKFLKLLVEMLAVAERANSESLMGEGLVDDIRFEIQDLTDDENMMKYDLEDGFAELVSVSQNLIDKINEYIEEHGEEEDAE
jgi:GH18 family chitinase